jgi:biotin carboxyl carrier protein
MKYLADIDGQEYAIEFSRSGDIVNAVIDGRSYEVETSNPGSGVHLIKDSGKIFEVFVSKDVSGKFHTNLSGSDLEIAVIDPKRLKIKGSAATDLDGIAEIKTAMPGKIVRVLVSVGDNVEKNDGVIVVEAMKMQNELKSPKSGVVRNIYFAEGSTVAAGDILISIE